jgi:hypothetical protein
LDKPKGKAKTTRPTKISAAPAKKRAPAKRKVVNAGTGKRKKASAAAKSVRPS